MISGGDKTLWGYTAEKRPSTTAKHPVSRLSRGKQRPIQKCLSGKESQSRINIITLGLHMHRWLKAEMSPHTLTLTCTSVIHDPKVKMKTQAVSKMFVNTEGKRVSISIMISSTSAHFKFINQIMN